MTSTGRGLLVNRDFSLLWSGQLLSSVGNQMFPVILALAVLQRNAGPAGLGLVLAVQAGGFACGTAASATFGDRYRRVAQMMAADTVRAIGVAVLAGAIFSLSFAVLLAVVALIGVAEGSFLPAYIAVVPRLVDDEELQNANALNALSTNIAMVAGPALGGALAGYVGVRSALWIDLASFGFSLATLLPISERHRAGPTGKVATVAKRSGRSDFLEALHAVGGRPWLSVSILTATILMTLVVAPAYVAAPVVARARLGGAAAYGAIFAALGVGSIIGSLIGGRLRLQRVGLVAAGGLLTIAGAAASLAALPLVAVLLLWGIAGIGVTVFQVVWATAVQRDVPDRLLGRVMALDQLGSQGLMPIGYGLAGFVLAAYGARVLLFSGAALVFVVVPLPLIARGGLYLSSRPVPDRGVPTS